MNIANNTCLDTHADGSCTTAPPAALRAVPNWRPLRDEDWLGCFAAGTCAARGAAASCTGRLLYNSICLPAEWPPRRDLDQAQHYPSEPPYAADCDASATTLCRPPVIDVTVGRQIFVDDWLVDNSASSGWRRVFHQANVSTAPVLVPDQPWEKGCAKAYSGGAFWDPDASSYKIWYSYVNYVAPNNFFNESPS